MIPTPLVAHAAIVAIVGGLAWMYFSKFSPVFKERRRRNRLRREWKGKMQ